jgi:hypothetical protein
MTLLDHVAHLRTLAVLDPETSILEMALVNVLEEMAEVLDELRGEPPHLGSV